MVMSLCHLVFPIRLLTRKKTLPVYDGNAGLMFGERLPCW